MGVIVGAAVTVLLWRSLTHFAIRTFPAYLQAVFGGGQDVVGGVSEAFLILFGLSVLLAVLPAFFAGGLVAGALARSSPGSHGAASAAVGLAIGFLRTVWVWLPSLRIEDAIARNDNAGTFSVWILALCVPCAPAILAGLLGGRLGGRLRRGRGAARPAPRSAS